MNKTINNIIGVIIIILIMTILMTLPTKIIWNATMPELFGLPTISGWMAFKLTLLSSILFKSSNTQKS